MQEELKRNLWTLFEYVIDKAEKDPELQRLLVNTAQGIQEEWSAPKTSKEDKPEEATQPEPKPTEHKAAPSAPAPVLRPEHLRWSIQEEDPEQTYSFVGLELDKTINDAELELIEDRCRMKAEGSRWAAMRVRRQVAGADFKTEIEPRDREIIEKAKELPDCFLWMNHNSGPTPKDLSIWEDVAGCFDALASAAALIREALDEQEQSPAIFEQAMDVAAEAQSALRTAIELVDQDHSISDKDQVKFFQWLRGTAASHQIFIERYMRVDDKADPTAWADLQHRIEALDNELNAQKQREKQHRNLMGRIRYHINKISKDPQGDHQDDWVKIVNSMDQLIEQGFPPSNSALREELLPIIDDIPDEHVVVPNVRLVLREIDRHLASRPVSSESPMEEMDSQDIEEVATLLEGKQVVLIGGNKRQQAKESLEKAFRLETLNWLETSEHQPIGLFEPYVGRPEVVLVLLAIRWSSHSFGDVRRFCENYGKPLVRLPGGYNPNQVAAQILSQASRQLQAVNAS